MRFLSEGIIAIAAVGFTFTFPVSTYAADKLVGQVQYELHCIMCHGNAGKGDGWLASYLRKPIPPLTLLTRNNGGAFPAEHVRQVIDGRKEVELHGLRDMPVWGQAFLIRSQRLPEEPGATYEATDFRVIQARIQELVNYISTLQE